jgi:proprotein convertase subtilisin/kexin type 5
VAYSAFVGNSWCLPCHPECLGCTAHPQNCIACALNTTYLDQTLGINICTQCKTPCLACTSQTDCSSCLDGYYLSSLTCAKCDPNCQTCNGPANSNCLSCFGSSNLIAGGFCSGCSSTCNQCSGTQCSGCVAGYFIYNGNCLSLCPQGSFGQNSTCVNCDGSCLSCNSTACLSCNSGFLYVLANKCYSNCPAGYAPS